jgi:hypothetical protein
LLLARSVASVVHAGQPLSKDGTTDASSGARSFRWVHAAVALLFFLLCGIAAYLARTPQTFAGRARVLGMAFVLFGLANLILAVLGTVSAFRRDGVASESDAQEISGARGAARELLAAFAGVPVLVALTMAPRLAQDAFPVDPSGREISRELQKQRIAGNQLFVAGMNRSMRYGVSFYLHDEVREWGAGTETGGYLLTGAPGCERVVGAGFYCEEQAFDAGHKTGRFLYLVIPEAGARQ